MACCLALAWGLAAIAPAHAGRWLAAPNNGLDTAVLLANGDVQVFSSYGLPLARRAFGPGCVALVGAPRGTLVAVLRRAEHGVVDCWDYGRDQVTQAPAELVADAVALALAADGRSLFVASAVARSVREVGDFLSPSRLIDVPRLTVGPLGLDLQVSPQNLYCAIAAPDALFLGPARGQALERYDATLSATAPPVARFTRDARYVLAGGDAQLLLLPTVGGVARRVPLSGISASPAFDLSSDGHSLFLADGPRLAHIDLATGRLRGLDTLRPDAARPKEALVSAALGAVEVLYDDDHVAWFMPARRLTYLFPRPVGTAVAPHPAAPAGPPSTAPLGPQPPPSVPPATQPVLPPAAPPAMPRLAAPHSAADLMAATARALNDPNLFQAAAPVEVIALDAHYGRMKDLEALAAKCGWQTICLGCVAVWSKRPDLAPEGVAPQVARLAAVDLLELPDVHPAAGVDADRLEAIFGPSVATKVLRMVPDGRLRPVYRFGALSLSVDTDLRHFPPGCRVWLGPELVRAALGP
jgi:hypothetical protein